MNIKTRLTQLAIGAFTIAVSYPSLSMEITLSEHSRNTLTATLSEANHNYSIFSLNDPERVVIDIDDAGAVDDLYILGDESSLIVDNVRSGIVDNNKSRIVLDISRQYEVNSMKHWRKSGEMTVSIEAYQKVDCTPNAINLDICEKAREIAAETSRQLPLRVSNDLTLEKIIPSNNTLNVFALLSYNIDRLEQAGAQQGLSISDFQNKTESYTINMACDENLGMKPFIGLGGEINYHYRFSDGTKYTTVAVESCP